MRQLLNRDPMHQLLNKDPWAWAQLLRAEEVLAEARASAALRALLRDLHPPRRRVRAWLGSVLLAVGHRLLRSVPTLGEAASPDEIRGMKP
jgi:hypothetical protein